MISVTLRGVLFTFHRGFPAILTLSARQAWGEACDHGTTRICKLHDCTGRVGAILPAIVAACPVEEVRVSDREPQHYYTHDYNVHAWYRGRREPMGDESWSIPVDVWELLEGGTVQGPWRDFPSPALAHAALSRAVIRHALQLTKGTP